MTPETPGQILVAAKGTYAGTVTLMTAAANTGKINDRIIVNRLEPARAAASEAIDLAEQLIKIGDPKIEDYVRAALSKAQNFRAIYDSIVKPQSNRRFHWVLSLS